MKIVIFWDVTPCNLVSVEPAAYIYKIDPDDGDRMFLRSVCIFLPDYKLLHPTRLIVKWSLRLRFPGQNFIPISCFSHMWVVQYLRQSLTSHRGDLDAILGQII
jgi:hypothetical protein